MGRPPFIKPLLTITSEHVASFARLSSTNQLNPVSDGRNDRWLYDEQVDPDTFGKRTEFSTRR